LLVIREIDRADAYAAAMRAAAASVGGLIVNGGDGVIDEDGVRRIGGVPIY
jgi:diacylglycerol kinase family enzyme